MSLPPVVSDPERCFANIGVQGVPLSHSWVPWVAHFAFAGVRVCRFCGGRKP